MQTPIYDHIFRIVKNTNSAREKAAGQSLKKERWEQLLNIKAVSSFSCISKCKDDNWNRSHQVHNLLRWRWWVWYDKRTRWDLFLFYFDKLFPWVYILSNAHCCAKCSPDKLLYLSLTVLPQPNYRFQVPPQPFIRKKIWHQLCWKVWSDFHLQYQQEAVVIRNMIFNFGKGWVLQFYGYRVENQSINRSSLSTPFAGVGGGD